MIRKVIAISNYQQLFKGYVINYPQVITFLTVAADTNTDAQTIYATYASNVVWSSVEVHQTFSSDAMIGSGTDVHHCHLLGWREFMERFVEVINQ